MVVLGRGGRRGGGGGGDGPRNPWSQPPRKRPPSGGNVTSLDDFLKKSREQFGGGGKMPNFGAGGRTLWPYALGMLDEELRPELVRRVEAKLGRDVPTAEPVPRGRHEAELAELLDEMTMVRRSAPAGARW